MNELFSLDNDALVPALRPAARVLLMLDEPEEKSGLQLNGRARLAATMKRISEIAVEAGHQVAFSPVPVLVDNEAPEVVLVDGNSRHIVETLQTARSEEPTVHSTIIALIPAKMRDELLEALRAAGADEFLSIDAPNFEVLSRLEAATSLYRHTAEISALRDQLGRQIRVDDLTGVMSRRFFFQQAHRECSRSRRYGAKLSCIMIEIDHFKSLCATFGDQAGEAVLRNVATIIGQWTRDSDLVARFTESKFALLLPETNIDGATRAQDKITMALASHQWNFDGRDLPVTVSIGEAELQPGATFRRVAGDYISEGDETGEAALSTRESLAGLLEDADAALFVARKGARMPDVFVPYTPVPEVILGLRPRAKGRKTPPANTDLGS
ncbi:GGDEF domain-containing protein [bacterium]|nr:MAG: GGDEF domain-containing protein [bacterium]